MDLDYLRRKEQILLRGIDLKYIRKEYLNFLNSKSRLLGLIGARGVGKTTLLLQYVKLSKKDTLYITADDVEFSNSKIYDIVDEFYALGGRVVIVDEVHKYKNWAQEIKNIYDTFFDLKIIISGSSMLNILYEKFDLSRRLVVKEMYPLNFADFLEFKYNKEFKKLELDTILENSIEITNKLIEYHPSIYADFKEYLKYGSYPFFIEDREFYYNKLINAVEKIIYEDIVSIGKIEYTQIAFFNKLIYKIVASIKPFKVNVSALAREFNISEPTLYSYLELLDKSAIFKTIKKASKKVSKKPEKILFRNSNLLYAFADKYFIEVDIGTTRETFFANCFRDIKYSDIGDFVVSDYIFEIGGKNKSFKQVKDIKDSYLAIDTDFTTNSKKIPLWLFGFIKYD